MSLFKVTAPEKVPFIPLTIVINSPRALQVLRAAVNHSYKDAAAGCDIEIELGELEDQLDDHLGRCGVSAPTLVEMVGRDQGFPGRGEYTDRIGV